MGSCAAPSAKGDDKFITTDYLQQCHSVHPLRLCASKRLTIPSTGRQNAAHFGSLRCAPALVTSNVSTTETQLYLAHVYSNGI
ncbi:hypothetical protein CP525_25850 [Salmonella enterica subsp. enterica serovar Heidelberg]|nr:hypothetical protein CP525_25850 [Salmonella enterica subsp. enterica serovar Heidelberg]